VRPRTIAAKTHCAVRRMIERRRVKSMLAVSVGIGKSSQDIQCDAGRKQYSESYEAVDMECNDFKLPVYIHLAPTTVPCLVERHDSKRQPRPLRS